ncbi:hypothetical protein HYT56_00445 [Candidatus Woesearchaeota archaeon]|nr:hypothetical protein [Candidatus Woesearchaeota archaeon]
MKNLDLTSSLESLLEKADSLSTSVLEKIYLWMEYSNLYQRIKYFNYSEFNLNLGDLQLILCYQKNQKVQFSFDDPNNIGRFQNDQGSQRERLFRLLRQVKKNSSDLPTTGIELGYTHDIPKSCVKFLNKVSRVKQNIIPLSYTSSNRSEIRLLPTNPYSFSWLLETVSPFMPKNLASVQFTVGNVNDERMPYIFLATYFLHPSCSFPRLPASHEKFEVNFPGVYVGASSDLNPIWHIQNMNLIKWGQTNYFVAHTSNVRDVSDVPLYLSKLHSLDDNKFLEFKNELLDFLGVNEGIMTHTRIEKRFPSAYKLPENIRNWAIGVAKSRLGLLELEKRIFNLSEKDAQRINYVNSAIKGILEKYTITDQNDMLYRCSLEDALKLV